MRAYIDSHIAVNDVRLRLPELSSLRMNGLNGIEEWQSYTTICRLCMQRDGFMLGIFNHIQGKDCSIHKKIMDCTALEISCGDGLPNSICHRCLYKIEFCLEFRQQCFVSDATLRQINGLSKEIQTTLQPTKESNVVMVVDPNAMDYESDCDSDVHNTPSTVLPSAEQPLSDVETLDTIDTFEYKNVHMCNYCDRAFTDKTECTRHEDEDHDAETPYRCAVCEQSYADRNAYSSHLKTAHQNDKPYACPECDRSFARRSDLRKHTIVHTGIKPYTCPICFKSFSRNTNLSKHIRIHKGQKPFVCHSCPRTFMSKLELTRHAVQHAGVKPFKCDKCDMSFMRKDKLQRHQKRHLPQENSRDTALELQAMRESLMNEYFAIAQDSNDNHIEPAPADEEPETDATKDEKDDWPSTENMVINIDPFSTENEPDNLNNSTESDLGNNSNISSPEKNNDDRNEYYLNNESNGEVLRYPCSLCNKTFRSTDGLNLHMGLHNGERPFGCNICGKAFLRKRELDRHSATHTGIKQFECTRCDKRFSRKDKLLRHSRIHEVNKEQCPICLATFNRKDGLAQHMKTHVKEEDETAAL